MELTIHDHRFEPASIDVPADTKVALRVRNMDATPEEFDSSDLHREKVVAAGQEGVVYIGPLKAGTYAFMGEFHPTTARGQIVAR